MDIKKTLEKLELGYSSYLHPNIVVKNSSIEGKGVFAKGPIRKGEIVNVFTGLIVTREEYLKLLKMYGKIIKSYKTKVADNFYLIPGLNEKYVADEDFINHSCDPNTGVRGQIMMVAMKNIKTGDEITYDYAMTDDDPEDVFQCQCQSKICRKTITGKDWKIPALQKKYNGYFSWHIQERVDKLKKK